MNNLSLHGKLDIVLNELAKLKDAGLLPEHEIFPKVESVMSSHEFNTILEYFIFINFAIYKNICYGSNCIPMDCYKISLDGLLFLEKTSFICQKRRYKQRQIWIIAKIIAITANAIAILIIMVLGILIQAKVIEWK